jgi:tetratricopeptide repeat protein
MIHGEIQCLLEQLGANADVDPDAAVNSWVQLSAHPGWLDLAAATRLAALDDASAAYAGTGNLDQAVAIARQALDATDPDDPDRPYRIATLAQRVRERYETTSDASDLAWLVELSRAAVEGSAPGAPELALRLTALGGALRLHHAACGDLDELDEAIWVFRQARELGAAQQTDPALHENNLAVALSDRYERTGRTADLDDAVATARRAVDRTPRGHADRSMYLTNLAVYLSDRYDRTGDLADLDDATAVAADALEDIDPADPELPRLQNLLAALHLDRYERFGRVPDLDLSITSACAAVAGARGAPELPGYLNNLGNAYRLRFEATLAATERHGPADLALNLEDLHGAVEAHRRAVELAPPGSPDRPKFLTNLGNAMVNLALVPTSEGGGLDEAIHVLSEAISATETGSPHQAARMNNLAHALRLRFDRSGLPEDRDRAIDAFRASCAAGLMTDLEAVLAAAGNWQRWATARRAWMETVEACDAGLRAAALLHRTQLIRDHQLAWLRAADGLAVGAALARSHSGDLRGAVTALEGGRALLLADALQRDRIDLARLAEREPWLTTRYAAAAEKVTRADPIYPLRH